MDDDRDELATEHDEAADRALTELLGSLPRPAMPEAVWARIQAALSIEQANAAVAEDVTQATRKLRPLVDKDVEELKEKIEERPQP